MRHGQNVALPVKCVQPFGTSRFQAARLNNGLLGMNAVIFISFGSQKRSFQEEAISEY